MTEQLEMAKIWVDLAQPRLGSKVVYATDDFFAAKERLIDPAAPVFIPGKYDANGKWMDGWESRRRRDGSHDYCIVKFGRAGVIKGIEIDTRHFTGNFPPAAALEWAHSTEELPPENAWHPLLGPLQLNGNSRLPISICSEQVVTHIRLHIFPDGGVARLRVYGQILPPDDSTELVDLAAMENGGLPVAANDEHFGQVSNMLAPGPSRDMGDGWETRRRREPGNDWAIISLGKPGIIEEIEVDTSHFKGNFPDRCIIQAAPASDLPRSSLITQSMFWPVILPEQKLSANARHIYSKDLIFHEPAKFLRLNIIPDGGIARLRARGRTGHS